MASKANMRLVVAALRSDEFTQGQGFLKVQLLDGTYRHCCLGVACEIAMRHGVELDVVKFSDQSMEGKIGFRFNGNGSDLPVAVRQWLGVSSNPCVDPEDAWTTAVAANDAHNWDFGRIADGFERTYGLLEGDDDTPGTD